MASTFAGSGYMPLMDLALTQGPSNNSNITSPTRSTDFWFNDGSVVLHAESCLFRVHHSILSMHSEVFRGMFSLPQPAAADGDVVEGCFVVRLHDRAVDWTHVLEAFYSGRHKRRFENKPWPFPVVAAYLRLGTKYEIRYLRAEAQNLLSIAFPSELDYFDIDNHGKPIAHYPALYFDAIALARETGRLCILPAVYFFICCSCEVRELSEGIKRADGTLSTLSVEEQQAILRGWRLVVEKLPQETLYGMLPSTEFDCDKKSCKRARTRIYHDLFGIHPPHEPDISLALRAWNREWDDEGMCSSCRRVCNRYHDIGNGWMWDVLPWMFGLPEWRDLLWDEESTDSEE